MGQNVSGGDYKKLISPSKHSSELLGHTYARDNNLYEGIKQTAWLHKISQAIEASGWVRSELGMTLNHATNDSTENNAT